MKKIKMAFIVVVVLFFGWLVYFTLTTKWHPGPGAFVDFKDIEGARIPDKCVQFKYDICGLFDCMVDMCWCDDSSPELPVLYEGNSVISDEEDAVNLVKEFAADKEVKRAVKLNSVFYNVFAEDENSNEEVYTIAVDGTIIKTICGV